MSRPLEPAAGPASNPFATRFVRPGAIEYLFPAGDSLDELVERARRARWCGAIVGRHGSGKSTLLATLGPALEAAGRRVIGHRVTDEQPGLHEIRARLDSLDTSCVVLVDGYERMRVLARWVLRWRCRRAGAGLIVTAHRPVGLPVLAQPAPSVELLQQLVRRLLRGMPEAIGPADVSAAFERERGNVREALFGLYELYESRRRC